MRCGWRRRRCSEADSYLGARYRTLRARIGTTKAPKAMARYLACLVYRLVTKGENTSIPVSRPSSGTSVPLAGSQPKLAGLSRNYSRKLLKNPSGEDLHPAHRRLRNQRQTQGSTQCGCQCYYLTLPKLSNRGLARPPIGIRQGA